ncbi:MAG: RdgB/HAM1 family non-canonical purine NTP pyrophosphatase [Atopobiaceae bacterium]|nr:RdgB/HAM1 family non-canonical purine NTP pyrophosphatase [Atopobiaceae bacterium]
MSRDELDPAHTVVVATGNLHKLTEIETILSRVLPQTRFVALSQLGDFPEPIENGDSFSANALIKAQDAFERTGFMAVADDSGLVVDALGGAPGIHSARWAGEHGNDSANNEKLMRELADVADDKRTARFHSTVVFVRGIGDVVEGNGDCEGMIGRVPRGSHGFGYDPLFLPNDTPGKTMAELMPDEKNAISHRFHALTDLARRLSWKEA